MKTKFLIFAIVLAFFSCSDDDNIPPQAVPEVVGTWKLVGVYLDPGDGSGDFETVDSQKTVQFMTDGTVTSNGSLCVSSAETDNPMSGTYSLEESTITSLECNDTTIPVTFELVNSQLIIHYTCIEPCKEKYDRI
ncbi:MAG: lipocalin family protein [Aquaticitalea sp.]